MIKNYFKYATFLLLFSISFSFYFKFSNSNLNLSSNSSQTSIEKVENFKYIPPQKSNVNFANLINLVGGENNEELITTIQTSENLYCIGITNSTKYYFENVKEPALFCAILDSNCNIIKIINYNIKNYKNYTYYNHENNFFIAINFNDCCIIIHLDAKNEKFIEINNIKNVNATKIIYVSDSIFLECKNQNYYKLFKINNKVYEEIYSSNFNLDITNLNIIIKNNNIIILYNTKFNFVIYNITLNKEVYVFNYANYIQHINLNKTFITLQHNNILQLLTLDENLNLIKSENICKNVIYSNLFKANNLINLYYQTENYSYISSYSFNSEKIFNTTFINYYNKPDIFLTNPILLNLNKTENATSIIKYDNLSNINYKLLEINTINFNINNIFVIHNYIYFVGEILKSNSLNCNTFGKKDIYILKSKLII